MGSLFSFTTIYLEVVERPFDRLTVLSNVEGHHNFAYYEAAREQCTHSDGHSLCLLNERCPLWGR
jgi:hypothetical protein